jgi:hypothetical protein
MDALCDLELDNPSLYNMIPAFADSSSSWRRMAPRLNLSKMLAFRLHLQPEFCSIPSSSRDSHRSALHWSLLVHRIAHRMCTASASLFVTSEQICRLSPLPDHTIGRFHTIFLHASSTDLPDLSLPLFICGCWTLFGVAPFILTLDASDWLR